METNDLILADEFCFHHNVELSFIYSLKESGIIEIVLVEEKAFLPTSQLAQLEKLTRLYYDMGINMEGIETITHLLNRMASMQQEIIRLSNSLNRFED
jgi:chaperone modulatory protein CbpM